MGRGTTRATAGHERPATQDEPVTGDEQGGLTRRALMVAGAAGIAALAGQAVGAPLKVAAANGDAIRIGQANDGTASTWLNGTSYPTFGARTTSGDGVTGETAGGGSGIYGHCTGQNGYGVWGRHEPTVNTGYLGGADDAVRGACRVAGHAGVLGTTSRLDGYGIRGENPQTKTVGVLGGRSAVSGVAMGGEDTYGLTVGGHAAFSASGVAVVPAGKSVKKITGIDVRAGCYVLATIQQYRGGVAIAVAVPSVAGQSITIYLTKTVAAATKVAWFMLDAFSA